MEQVENLFFKILEYFIEKNIISSHGIILVILLLYLYFKLRVSNKTQNKVQRWIGKLQYKLREKDLNNHHVFS